VEVVRRLEQELRAFEHQQPRELRQPHVRANEYSDPAVARPEDRRFLAVHEHRLRRDFPEFANVAFHRSDQNRSVIQPPLRGTAARCFVSFSVPFDAAPDDVNIQLSCQPLKAFHNLAPITASL